MGDPREDMLVEECAGLAVVRTLASMTTTIQPHEWVGWAIQIPIAPAPPSLLERVAMELAISATCPACYGGCIECQDTGRTGHPPPFAAAYSDTPTGRVYVLASAACDRCQGNGAIGLAETVDQFLGLVRYTCHACNGTGARTDVGAIAARYPGDHGEDTAHLARFEVER